jgi:TonB-linked SusC/RagA family outer membrane protein
MQFSFAQEKTVTGTITDGKLPLPGANVVIKGTTNGVAADMDGKFSIKAKAGDVLVVSFTGYDNKTITVGAANSYKVALAESATKLDEVVIQGYGKTATKPKAIGSSNTISAKTIEGRPNTNVLQSLQGQLAGANIALSSGQPGTNKIDVIIRGLSTLGADSDPLYVIDGVPLTQSFFRNLNPNDIETVSVLKDAAATSVYGNRGTNGVIVINTKKGSYKSGLDINYSSSYGLSEFRGENYNKVNAQQHLALQRDLGVGPGSGAAWPGQTLDPNNLGAYAIDTDWAKVFFRTGTTNSHDISFTSGSENLKNFTSFGYFQQDGIIKTSAFKRFTVRTNFTGKSKNEKFTYGLNVSSVYSRRNQLEQETRAGINNNVLQNPLNGYLLSSNYYDPNTYVTGQQLFDDFGSPALDLTPFMLMDLFKDNRAPSFFDEFKTTVTGNFGYKLTKNLTFSATTGVDYADDRRVFAIGPEAYLSIVRAVGAGQPFHGLEVQRSARELMFNHVNQLSYKKTFGKHSFDVSLYTEYVKAHRRVTSQQQIGLNPLTWSPGAGTGYIPYNLALPLAYAPTVGASKTNAGLFSYFGTTEYDYDSKYGFSATLRRDASYRFVDDNKWGTFWSVGGRWNINRESFLEGNSTIKELKLRASYGTTGNQNIVARDVDADASSIFNFSNGVRDLNSVQQGYGNNSSFGVATYANRDAKWETTAQANIGLDYNIKGRLTGSFDVYRRKTTDLFTSIPVSASNGIPGNSLSGNNGALVNEGVEISFRYDILKNTKLKLSVYANGAKNNNKIDDLGVLDDGTGKQRIGSDFVNAIGGKAFQYFVVPYVGVNPANGNLLFLDINGNPTENPTDADRRQTGKNYLPVYQGGFGLDASYKGFFVNAAFVYATDFYRFDIDYEGLMDIRNVDPFPVSADLLNAWTPTNTNTDVPSLSNTNFDSGSISDRFLRNSSYLRLRNISIGYNVPSKFLEKTFIKSVRFRLQGENLLTFTKWKGFDPESFETSTTGNFPLPRLYTFGVDINF